MTEVTYLIIALLSAFAVLFALCIWCINYLLNELERRDANERLLRDILEPILLKTDVQERELRHC
jgi:hypothetical protein